MVVSFWQSVWNVPRWFGLVTQSTNRAIQLKQILFMIEISHHVHTSHCPNRNRKSLESIRFLKCHIALASIFEFHSQTCQEHQNNGVSTTNKENVEKECKQLACIWRWIVECSMKTRLNIWLSAPIASIQYTSQTKAWLFKSKSQRNTNRWLSIEIKSATSVAIDTLRSTLIITSIDIASILNKMPKFKFEWDYRWYGYLPVDILIRWTRSVFHCWWYTVSRLFI